MLKSKYNVFIDSDGVIVDFNAYVLEKFGALPSEIHTKKFWQMVTEYDASVEKFFLNMKKTDDADDLINFCRDRFQSVKILTACGYTPKDTKEQKLQWYEDNYPELECIVVRKYVDKAMYANQNSILIDDREKSITPWVAAGGIGILHTSAAQTITDLFDIIYSENDSD